MTLEDLIRTDAVTASPDTGVETLATKMHEENVGSVLIVEDDWPIGLVTDRDLAVRVLARGKTPAGMTARDVMTGEPTTVPVETGLFELTERMEAAGVRRMPVVDGDDLVGIITLDDVTRLLVRELSNLEAVVAAESPPY
jgi:CBS domain-containing protein